MARLKSLMWIVLGALLAVAALALYWHSVADGSLERVRASRTLRIGFAVEAPHAFYSRSGEVSGQSPEVARHVAARLGVHDIEWRLMDFGELLKELREGRIDLVAAGMFITPERAALVGFSDPIFRVKPGLLVRRGNPHRLHSYADLRADARLRVAVLSGAVEADALRQAGVAEARLVMVPDVHTGRVAVETGLADALALAAPTIKWLTLHQQLGKTESARPFGGSGPESAQDMAFGGFAFRKADKSLLEAWNREQRAFLATAEFRALMQGFGFDADEMPGDATAKEILAR